MLATVQGETGATPGWEAVGKPHRSDVKPIKKAVTRDGKPVIAVYGTTALVVLYMHMPKQSPAP